jgi:hypothetical protein
MCCPDLVGEYLLFENLKFRRRREKRRNDESSMFIGVSSRVAFPKLGLEKLRAF